MEGSGGCTKLPHASQPQGEITRLSHAPGAISYRLGRPSSEEGVNWWITIFSTFFNITDYGVNVPQRGRLESIWTLKTRRSTRLIMRAASNKEVGCQIRRRSGGVVKKQAWVIEMIGVYPLIRTPPRSSVRHRKKTSPRLAHHLVPFFGRSRFRPSQKMGLVGQPQEVGYAVVDRATA